MLFRPLYRRSMTNTKKIQEPSRHVNVILFLHFSLSLRCSLSLHLPSHFSPISSVSPLSAALYSCCLLYHCFLSFHSFPSESFTDLSCATSLDPLSSPSSWYCRSSYFISLTFSFPFLRHHHHESRWQALEIFSQLFSAFVHDHHHHHEGEKRGE